jgi:glutamine cyclotransferase
MSFTVFRLRRIPLYLALLVLLLSGASTGAAPVDSYRVVAKYPHSAESYTEGFLYLDGMFYEGTGRIERSAVMALDPKTGKVITRRDLPPEYFGEGIVDWGPYILEWTWKSHMCFVYDRLTLQPVTRFTYAGEGWGMTRNATELITSDGSATLRFRDPNTFQETHYIVVKDGGNSIDNLNELEFVKGEIYANVWHSDRIARISPQGRPWDRVDRPHRFTAVISCATTKSVPAYLAARFNGRLFLCHCHHYAFFALTVLRPSILDESFAKFFRLDISGRKAHKKSSRKWRRTWRFRATCST